MTVTQLARMIGIEPHVVRYYVRVGLLRPVRDPKNGYKLFHKYDADRLVLIRQAQELGFSLAEITELLDSPRHGSSLCCQHIHDALKCNLEKCRHKIQELQKKQSIMEAALSNWDCVSGCGISASSTCIYIQQNSGKKPFNRF